MTHQIHQSWNKIYDSYDIALHDKTRYDKMKFYHAKPTDVLDKLYLVAVERQHVLVAEIIFEILRER